MAWGPEEAFAKKLKCAVPHRVNLLVIRGECSRIPHPTVHCTAPTKIWPPFARGNFHSQDPKLTFADKPALLIYSPG